MGVNVPVGSANGVIVKAPGEPTVYHMGDTDIFGDMGLIAEIHQPDVVIVPIGDRFTMGPEVAALAVRRYLQGQGRDSLPLRLLPDPRAERGQVRRGARRHRRPGRGAAQDGGSAHLTLRLAAGGCYSPRHIRNEGLADPCRSIRKRFGASRGWRASP